jgi:DNA polymerase-3 subunit epsilon
MRLCAIDFETTGLDFKTDWITEVAYIIKDVGDPKPLALESMFIRPSFTPDFLRQEIINLTKITYKHLEGGVSCETAIGLLANDIHNYGVDYIVAHNGQNFDKPMLEAVTARLGLNIDFATPWLDTSVDIVYPPHMTSRRLTHLAAEHNFLNPFPHSALFDVETMLTILERYDIHDVIARSKEPWVLIRAMVNFENKDKAKKRRFFWETIGEKTYPKCWVKQVKASDLEKEKQEADFEIITMGT